MRILKEYSALSNPLVLTDQNSILLSLTAESEGETDRYITEAVRYTNADKEILTGLKVAASDIFDILTENAAENEKVRLSCTYHKYYYMLVFEFSEAALPLHTLNKTVKLLNSSEIINVGFMDLVHLVNRIELSVDKSTEKMRLSVIKEKTYSVPEYDGELPVLGDSFEIYSGFKLIPEFSQRVHAEYGNSIDRFLISPGLLADNLDEGELDAVFLRDENGCCAGGAVWQKVHGIIVLAVFSVFAESKSAVDILLNELENRIKKTGANFVVSQICHSDAISGYFEVRDEKYCYKPLFKEQKHISYMKPDLIPIIKKAYKNLDISREIRQINHNPSYIEPHSVLTAKVDAEVSQAVLSIMWFGDDLKANIIRHVIALKKIGIRDIYFKLDLSNFEETAVSDLVQDCGFEAKYLMPYSSITGDIVVFVYCENAVYEIKPCIIEPADKSNINKTSELVRKVYGENYPSQYLYDPEKLWAKIRKRDIFLYLAINVESDIQSEQKAAGMISFIRLSVNPYLFEIGQLMIDPAHRGTNVINQLIEYIYTTAIQKLDFDGILSESVTNHKLSQRSCVNSGFIDTALKLNIMSGEAFSLEEDKRHISRMSCVVSCIERADEKFTVYLPGVYSEQIKFCYESLKPRIFLADFNNPAAGSSTEYKIDDSEAKTSHLINVTILSIGSDIEETAEIIDSYAVKNDIKSLLVNIPLGNSSNPSAVKAFRERGFFFGGVIPYWYTDSDGLLMQKLYDNSPDWDNIKLFSRKIKRLAEIIKKDMKSQCF